LGFNDVVAEPVGRWGDRIFYGGRSRSLMREGAERAAGEVERLEAAPAAHDQMTDALSAVEYAEPFHGRTRDACHARLARRVTPSRFGLS
jgi:hypothetical protein